MYCDLFFHIDVRSEHFFLHRKKRFPCNNLAYKSIELIETTYMYIKTNEVFEND